MINVAVSGAAGRMGQTVCDAVETVMETEEMRRYIADSELVPGFMRPDEFRAFVEQQNELTISWMERF